MHERPKPSQRLSTIQRPAVDQLAGQLAGDLPVDDGALAIDQQVRRRDILKIKRQDFISSWPIVKDGIFTAVDFIRSHLRIPVSRLLPYNALLVPLTYFFIRNFPS